MLAIIDKINLLCSNSVYQLEVCLVLFLLKKCLNESQQIFTIAVLVVVKYSEVLL